MQDTAFEGSWLEYLNNKLELMNSSGSEHSEQGLYQPYDAEDEGPGSAYSKETLPSIAENASLILGSLIHERGSSLSRNRIEPLRISKTKDRSTSYDSSGSAPQSSVYSSGPQTPRGPPTSRSHRFEPDSPYSFPFSDACVSDAERHEHSSVNSTASPPSLSYSTRVSDPNTIKAYEKLRRKHNCARELYNTEWKFAQDMAVVVRIYMCGSAEVGLTFREIQTLFSNVSHIMDLSLSLVAILESQIPNRILDGNGSLDFQDLTADQDLRIGRAMCLALTGQMYEIYESYIHKNKSQMDLCIQLTSQLTNHPQKRLHANDSDNSLARHVDQEKLIKWLQRCKERVSKFTTAWSLASLLIKPVQRLGQYPLLLKTMLECTDPQHCDYEDLQRAYKRSKQYLDCVNARYGSVEHQ